MVMRCLHLAMWVTIGYFGLGLTTASAYLDPGTGSMILQAVIGAVAGALIVIKLYWYKLVAFFKEGDLAMPGQPKIIGTMAQVTGECCRA